jgi:hypothetical protein
MLPLPRFFDTYIHINLKLNEEPDFQFEEEVLERRDILISSTCDLMSTVLCPDKLELTSW